MMPALKSTALDAGSTSAVSEPIIQPSSFAPEINDDDLDMLMNIIEKGNNISKTVEAAMLNKQHSGKTNVKYQ
jgi:hypothetical protein